VKGAFVNMKKRAEMDVTSYYKSLTKELESLKDRVRNFIDDAHWLTDGEWKESVLRSILGRRLPDTVKVGRGFIVSEGRTSTQCDVLLYRASSPVLFREGDLVFLTPDAVLSVLEVKSRTDQQALRKVIQKFAGIGKVLGGHRSNVVFGLFSYETDIHDDRLLLEVIQNSCTHEKSIVDLVCLGCSTFVKWWKFNPDGGNEHYERWHSYYLGQMAAGYFLTNLVDFICPESVSRNSRLWFPREGKEINKTGEIALNALNASDNNGGTPGQCCRRSGQTASRPTEALGGS
jgi:hypothetical protein